MINWWKVWLTIGLVIVGLILTYRIVTYSTTEEVQDPEVIKLTEEIESMKSMIDSLSVKSALLSEELKVIKTKIVPASQIGKSIKLKRNEEIYSIINYDAYQQYLKWADLSRRTSPPD